MDTMDMDSDISDDDMKDIVPPPDTASKASKLFDPMRFSPHQIEQQSITASRRRRRSCPSTWRPLPWFMCKPETVSR